MKDIHKVRAMLGVAGAVLAVALVYLFGLSPESKPWEILLDVGKVVLVLFLLSALILFVSLWSEDFYRTPYSRYMESLWDSWGLNSSGVSLCWSNLLGFFTLCLWIVMLACAYTMIHVAYSVGMGGYEHFFTWDESEQFIGSVSRLVAWSVLSSLGFACLYCQLVLKFKQNKATISFSVLFVTLCIGATWILGSIHTFGWEGVELALYWTAVVFLGFCMCAIVLYALFHSLSAPIVTLIQNLWGVKEGFCPIIPRMPKKEKTNKS